MIHLNGLTIDDIAQCKPLTFHEVECLRYADSLFFFGDNTDKGLIVPANFSGGFTDDDTRITCGSKVVKFGYTQNLTVSRCMHTLYKYQFNCPGFTEHLMEGDQILLVWLCNNTPENLGDLELIQNELIAYILRGDQLITKILLAVKVNDRKSYHSMITFNPYAGNEGV